MRNVDLNVGLIQIGQAHGSTSSNDPMSSVSRTRFVTMYTLCPIIGKIFIQSPIAVSTIEAKFIPLSSSRSKVIGIIKLLYELCANGFIIKKLPPLVKHKAFKEYKSCIDIATNHKTHSHTKHLSMCFHHLCNHVEAGTILIEYINEEDRIAFIFTKPLQPHNSRNYATVL